VASCRKCKATGRSTVVARTTFRVPSTPVAVVPFAEPVVGPPPVRASEEVTGTLHHCPYRPTLTDRFSSMHDASVPVRRGHDAGGVLRTATPDRVSVERSNRRAPATRASDLSRTGIGAAPPCTAACGRSLHGFDDDDDVAVDDCVEECWQKRARIAAGRCLCNVVGVAGTVFHENMAGNGGRS
jgi:hypothetical protein